MHLLPTLLLSLVTGLAAVGLARPDAAVRTAALPSPSDGARITMTPVEVMVEGMVEYTSSTATLAGGGAVSSQASGLATGLVTGFTAGLATGLAVGSATEPIGEQATAPASPAQGAGVGGPSAEPTPDPAAEPTAGDSTEETPSSLAMMEPYLKYGPWAILAIFILSGVGLHLSEDFILIPAGFLIAHGEHLDLWETLIAAYCGLVIGDILWIAMCRRFGTRMVQSRWFKRIIHPRRLLEAKHQMEQRGIVVVILARFIPGTRTPVITMAGILHMAWWKLLTVEFLACAVTVPLQVGLGYLMGKGLGESKSTGELVVKLVAATAAVVLAGVVIHWWVSNRKRAGRAPRSKASWLRTFGRRRRDAAVSAPLSS